jgi:hypothetical protein
MKTSRSHERAQMIRKSEISPQVLATIDEGAEICMKP